MHTFQKQIVSCFHNFINSNSQYHEELQNLVKSVDFASFLTALSADPRSTEAIARRSYTHYNEFDKFVLFCDEKTGCELRLHAWWPHTRRSKKENIHDHRWNFSSVILRGSYDYEIFCESDSGKDMFQLNYETRENKQSYQTPLVGNKKLKCISKGVRSSGTAYSMQHDVLHRIKSPVKEPTITLLLQGQSLKSHARVFTERKPIPLKEIDALPFSPTEVTSKFRAISRLLS